MEKQKYEQAGTEYEKWHSSIKFVLGETLLLFQKTGLYTVCSEYG